MARVLKLSLKIVLSRIVISSAKLLGTAVLGGTTLLKFHLPSMSVPGAVAPSEIFLLKLHQSAKHWS